MFSLGQKMNDFFGISEIESCYCLLMLTNHCIRKDFTIKLGFDLYGIFFFAVFPAVSLFFGFGVSTFRLRVIYQISD